MPLTKDFLHPSLEEAKRKHKKKKHLALSPSSCFTGMKCPGSDRVTIVLSHVQTVVLCVGCSTVLCQSTGGKARLTEAGSSRQMQH
ncbi:40S ribosomal protein S27-like [Enhydra lutris kenyoni]|uniref:40S ribosomal protein S27-like n=1 Tax=Enhydra lutris kenyoni TaxID=391180 RepID=A0A2Y9L9M8_ENHLU|nr:40S ribosomal protein S27-like [Enhydra lutris kenyoni]